MKNIFLAFATIIISLMIITSCGNSSSNGRDDQSDVIICLSEDAYAYHDHQCMGLGQCDSNTEEISIAQAKNMGRKACGFCY